MLQTRLPEMLATHYQLTNINVTNENSEKRLEASKLLQSVLDNIEQRLDRLLAQMDEEQLKELRVMKHYINSHDSWAVIFILSNCEACKKDIKKAVNDA